MCEDDVVTGERGEGEQILVAEHPSLEPWWSEDDVVADGGRKENKQRYRGASLARPLARRRGSHSGLEENLPVAGIPNS